MNEIKIDPRADRRAVLETLLRALDMLDPDEGERALATLHEISFDGETRGHAPAPGLPTLASVSEQTVSDEQI